MINTRLKTLATTLLLYKIDLGLTVIGSINWGLIGLFDCNLVSTLFGVNNPLNRVVYILVGLSALYVTFAQLRTARHGSSLRFED